MKHLFPWILAALLVSALRLGTPVARIMTDGAEYLHLAEQGFSPGAHLGAPFAYRIAVPMLVRAASALTGAAPAAVFPVVVLIAGFGVLLAGCALAGREGASPRNAAFVMLLLAASLFAVRFPLYCPFDVDIEACLVSCAAFACVRRGSMGAAIAVSLGGLLFKEFLLAPLAAITIVFLLRYAQERSVRPLQSATLTVVLTLAVFLIPRLLIPVTSSFGTIIEYRLPSPSRTLYFSQLRMFLAWPPRPATAVNILLALLSFWLPALMLWTRSRGGAVLRAAGGNRILFLVWLAAVVGLMTVGGTKIMVFAVYTLPFLAATLGVILETGPHPAEVLFVLAATALFNRIVFPLGSPGGDPGVDIGFYGAYGLEITDATLRRLAEAAGWVGAAVLMRLWLRRKREAEAPAAGTIV